MTEPVTDRPVVTASPNVPAWSSPADGCRLVLRGVTFRTCGLVALVVPFVVASIGYLAPFRCRDSPADT